VLIDQRTGFAYPGTHYDDGLSRTRLDPAQRSRPSAQLPLTNFTVDERGRYRQARSSCQALRIGAMVGTGSVVRKSMMSVLQSAGFSTSSPCEVPGTIASSPSGRLR
jgi:hypothetical protein